MPDLIIKFGDSVGQILPVKRIEMIVQEISNDEFEDLNKKRNATPPTKYNYSII